MLINLLFLNPIQFVIVAAMLILAIAVHEFAHALSADRLGDPTARLAGRLTLNPMAHLDPLGSILLLVAGFGWGKPVPFDPFNLRSPKKDAAIISFSGPFSNLIMAAAAGLIYRFLDAVPIMIPGDIGNILGLFIYFNVLLGIFNLVPVHPLDGFKVVAGVLPKKYYHDWLSLEPYGMIFLILLIFPFFGTPPIVKVISPIVDFLLNFLLPARVGGII